MMRDDCTQSPQPLLPPVWAKAPSIQVCWVVTTTLDLAVPAGTYLVCSAAGVWEAPAGAHMQPQSSAWAGQAGSAMQVSSKDRLQHVRPWNQ